MIQYGQKQGLGTKAWGIGAVVVLHAFMGWVLISGLGNRVVDFIVEPIITEVIEDIPPPPEDVPPPPPPPDIDVPPPPMVPIPEIQFDAPPPPTAVQAVQAGEPVAETPVVVPPAPPAPTGPTTNPQRRGRAGELPPYPEASLRLNEEGETVVRVCVSADGRVESADVSDSSGSRRLDTAAVNWLRRQRFDPGLTNGVPEAKCTQTIVAWEIPR